MGGNGQKPAIIDGQAPGSYGNVSITLMYMNKVTVDRDISVGNLSLMSAAGGSELSVSAGKTLSVNFASMTNGTLSGAGTLEMNGSASSVMNVIMPVTISVAAWNVIPVATVNLWANVNITSANVSVQGTVNWNGGNITLAGTLTNTGQFLAQCSQDLNGDGTFNNYGLFRKGPQLGVTNINTKFNGVGSSLIDVASGDLNVNSVGFDSGEINVVPGAHFYWEANARRTVQGALTLTGLGSVQMMAATLVVPVNSNLVNANTPFTLSGTLQGPGNVVMSAPLYWSDGAIEGFSNGLILGGVTTLGPALSKYITRGTILTLTNTTDWRGNNIYIDGDAAIENYGVFTIRADSDLVSLGAGASFNNRDGALGRGVVQKTSGAGVTRIEVAFVNEGDLFLNGRKITFQEGLSIPSGGLANLGGGVLGLDAGQSVVVSGGMLTGGGVVGGDLSVTQGWVIVTSGATLSVAGDYIQGAVAILQFQYQNAWGSLVVGGTASLAGMLDVVVAAGSPPNVWTDVLTATNSVQFTFSVTPARYNVQYSAIAVQIKKP